VLTQEVEWNFGDVQIFCTREAATCGNKVLQCFPKIEKYFWAIHQYSSRDGTPKQLQKHPDTMKM